MKTQPHITLRYCRRCRRPFETVRPRLRHCPTCRADRDLEREKARQQRVPCQGKTAKGQPCSHRAVPGFHYCWWHIAPEGDLVEQEIKRQMAALGLRPAGNPVAPDLVADRESSDSTPRGDDPLDAQVEAQ